MARQDILLDSDNLPLLANGDLVTGDSDDQHVELLMMTHPGEWKETPLTGIGARRYINGVPGDIARLKRDITVGLAADGYKVNSLAFDGGDFKLDYQLL